MDLLICACWKLERLPSPTTTLAPRESKNLNSSSKSLVGSAILSPPLGAKLLDAPVVRSLLPPEFRVSRSLVSKGRQSSQPKPDEALAEHWRPYPFRVGIRRSGAVRQKRRNSRGTSRIVLCREERRARAMDGKRDEPCRRATGMPRVGHRERNPSRRREEGRRRLRQARGSHADEEGWAEGGEQTQMIRRLKSGKYRLYSRKKIRRPASAATSARSNRGKRR